MSTRDHTFSVDGTPSLSIRMPLGEVRIVDGAPGEVAVRLDGRDSAIARFIVEQRGDEIVIEPDGSSRGWRSSVDLTVRVGTPPRVSGRLAASDLNAGVPLRELTVDSAAGDISTRDIGGDATIRTASGDVRIGDVAGALEVTTASGDVRAGTVERDVLTRTASGDVRIGSVAGDVTGKSASGDVQISQFTGSSLDLTTLSGEATVGVTSGRTFEVDLQTLSGEVRTDFPVSGSAPGGSTARLSIKTISGDIEIRAAT
jgi:hypothetical protein